MSEAGIRRDAHDRVIYEPDGVVLTAYLMDRSPVSIIRGPIGSGTSSASCIKLGQLAAEQAPLAAGPKRGLRSTKWAIVRNSYPELEETTIPTWLDWYPEEIYGRFYWDPPYNHPIRFGDIDMEVIFLALDKQDDVKKLRSMELTGFWVNEMEFVPKVLVDEMDSRAGRYPARKYGGATWSGIIADLNAPSEDHWLPMMMGEVPLPEDLPESEHHLYERPRGWAYFVQPPGMLEVMGPDGKVVGYKPNPAAENVRWLPPGYYERIVAGKSRDWIESRIMNRIVPHRRGRPVWPMFRRETHVATQALRPVPGLKVWVGLDFGRRPAAVFAQLINGRWAIQFELIGRDEGATIFAPKVARLLAEQYGIRVRPEFWRPGGGGTDKLALWGDPKGADKVQSGERTAYDVFRSFHLPVQAAPVPSNDIATRIGAVEYVLNGMIDGRPRFLVDARCRTLVMAMAGAYCFKKTDPDRPEKDGEDGRWSDVADALQYVMVGAGEVRVMTGRERAGASAPTDTRGRRSRRRGPGARAA